MQKGNSLSRRKKLAPPPITVAWWTDLHLPHSVAAEHRLAAAAFINEESPSVLIHAGDANAPVEGYPRYCDWVHMSVDDGGAGINPAIVDLPVLGNHDTETPISADWGTTPPDPFATIKGEYPGLFQGRDYYHYDLESGDTCVRLIQCNNLTDCINEDTGHPNYHNCNPPGADDVNPDHSGWTVPGSPQRVWLDEMSASHHEWKIVTAHRPMWSNFDGAGRPMHRVGRVAMWTPIDNGVDMVVSGDQHVGCLAGRFFPGDVTPVGASSNGAYALTLSGGFAVREHDDSLLPAGSILWSSSGAVRPALIQVAVVTFQGTQARIKIWQAEQGVAPGVVHEQWLVRNRGLAS